MYKNRPFSRNAESVLRKSVISSRQTGVQTTAENHVCKFLTASLEKIKIKRQLKCVLFIIEPLKSDYRVVEALFHV